MYRHRCRYCVKRVCVCACVYGLSRRNIIFFFSRHDWSAFGIIANHSFPPVFITTRGRTGRLRVSPLNPLDIRQTRIFPISPISLSNNPKFYVGRRASPPPPPHPAIIQPSLPPRPLSSPFPYRRVRNGRDIYTYGDNVPREWRLYADATRSVL